MLDATATRSDADIPATSEASDPPARSIASPALTPVLRAIAPSGPSEGAIASSDFHDEERSEGYVEGDVGGSELQPDGDNDDHMEDDWDHEELNPWAGLYNLDMPFEEFRGRFGLMFEESFPITSNGRESILWRRVFDDFHASGTYCTLTPHDFTDSIWIDEPTLGDKSLVAVFTNEDRLAWYQSVRNQDPAQPLLSVEETAFLNIYYDDNGVGTIQTLQGPKQFHARDY
ncbi:hypothetical protein PsorP6_010889 [Peronosclerospora sorghi]|uniref:Uncharacterized protein n=1 Tax=Peronosclerospora sorghi TaxID=230839 RepID=A0ACC0VUY6_9STRA|nr:hypothetical protein PsorP6_010889 [Peronosclerospora sorghi]